MMQISPWLVVIPPTVGERGMAMIMYVCLSVCSNAYLRHLKKSKKLCRELST